MTNNGGGLGKAAYSYYTITLMEVKAKVLWLNWERLCHENSRV